MIGQAIIIFKGGWACSNDCEMDLEKDIDITTRTSIATTVLKIKGLFNVKSEIIKDYLVSLVFRNEKGENFGFNGQVRSVIDQKATIVLTTKHTEVNKILNTLKQENHGR